MSRGKKMGCIPRLILVGGLGVAAIALAAYLLDQISPGTGTVLWDGLGELLAYLAQKIKSA